MKYILSGILDLLLIVIALKFWPLALMFLLAKIILECLKFKVWKALTVFEILLLVALIF